VSHQNPLFSRHPSLIAHRASLIAVVLFGGCGTERFYEGAKLPPEQVAVVHVADTIVLEVDGTGRRGGYFSSPRIALKPGRHTFTLGFEKVARAVGAKEMPAMRGEGTCTLEVDAEAGKQYWLGSMAVGPDWTGLRWDGKWHAWIRDPSVDDEDDIVARCDSRPAPEEVEEVATPVAAPGREVALAVQVPVAHPTPPPSAAAGAAAPEHPSAGFAGGLDPAVWIVRSRDNYRVVVRRLCSTDHCRTESYLQSVAPRRVVNEAVEQLVMEEKTTVPIEEASSVSAFVEDVRVVDRQGTFAFELHITDANDAHAARVRLLVFPLPDGGYRATEVAAEP
jgi:hypothetical protein